jgi:alkylation response protein AidB-like acyl-CoA dehydrogenase
LTTAPAPGGSVDAAPSGTDDLAALRAEVRALVERWLEQGRFTARCDAWLRGHDPEFTRALAEHDWIGITWPTEVGGAGRSNLARLVVTEELLRAGAPVAAHWIADRQIGPAILRYGSPELQRAYLPRIASGEVTFCLGMSETESGSDLASVRTVAERVEGGWRLRGRKIWTSQAHLSSHGYVLARTDASGTKHEGLTEFVVDMSAEGVEVRPIHDLRGDHHFNEVTFDGVFIPADHVLGAVGNGWKQVTEQLAFERGGMERVLSTYPLLAATVTANPAPAPEIATRLGVALARLATLRGLAVGIAVAMDGGRAPVQQAAMLKDLGTTFEGDMNELAREVLDIEPDPFGEGEANLLAQGVLAAPGFTIRGGTTEVLRTIIAKGTAKPDQRARADETGLRAMADDVLAGHGGDPAGEPGDLPPVWATLTELGWPGVATSEDRGGSGGDLGDLAALVEACGRNTVAVPLAETAWARHLLADAGHELPDGSATVVLPRAGERLIVHNATLSGTATRVPWACAADHLVVLAEDDAGTAVLVTVPGDAAGIERGPGTNLAAEPRDTVRFHDVAVDGEPAPVDPVRATAAGALLRMAAMVGALETAVEHTVRHVTVREQFGRPLIAFQAVGATLARMAAQVTLARTALAAAVAASRNGVDVERAAAAVVIAGSAATEVARGAHQLHGAMGVSREHPLHLATRRLWSWRDEFGGDRHWARVLGERLLPLGADGVWDWVTADTANTQSANNDTGGHR